MKNYILILILTTISFGACTDLDLLPPDRLLADKAFRDQDSFKQYLAKIYASLSLTGQEGPAGDTDLKSIQDEGFTNYIRVYWMLQQLTTDETINGWADGGLHDLHNHVWSSENQFIRVMFYRIFYTISLSNDFLTISTESGLDELGISEEFRPEIRRFRAEARFMRALAYSHALDFYRNVAIITAPSSVAIAQSTPQATFDFIIQELNEIEEQMAEPRTNEYGRADKAALWMLKAKLFLNAEVFIDEDKYEECLKECEKIIAVGYELSEDYQLNFRADNHTSPELIFTLPADGANTQSWGSTTFLVHAAIGGSMTDTDYGVLNV